MMLFLLALAFFIIAAVEVPGLVKNKSWRELLVFSVLYLLAFTISVLQVMDIELPSPVRGITTIIKAVQSFLFN